ncbi:GDP-D-glucose phosphorylase 1 isoform X1 [Aplysia californica]|uniref:GDP-D-glucose phosphorylase 1 n=1 Tax=Aplysia californica TaxID=6500 RepID=A0ABM1VXK2_APLCA|nr:GDP-D-glucose phosphorylase 1 isoform X1 [Aplysia californica]
MSIVQDSGSEVARYDYTEDDFVLHTAPWADGQPSQLSPFDKELHKRWDAAMAAGAFRYGIDHILTRIIPGSKGYVGQLNTLRATERRKPQEISSVSQPFNPKAFNFTWIKPGEVIFDLHNTTDGPLKNGDASAAGEAGHVSDGAVTNGHAQTTEAAQVSANGVEHSAEGKKSAVHRLVINVSPMEYGHCLLVPDVFGERPQVLTLTALKVAIETLLLCKHRGARLGFNSLCALSSVNHQHFHMYYFTYEQIVDHYPVDHLAGDYYEFTSLPCPGFVMQLHGTTVEGLARSAHKISSYLHENDIAHNLFMCRGVAFGEKRDSTLTTIRLFIWPRKKFIAHLEGNKSSEEFNVACIELGGHLPIKEEAGYYNLTEEDVDKIIETACLSEEHYQEIKATVIKMGQEVSNAS